MNRREMLRGLGAAAVLVTLPGLPAWAGQGEGGNPERGAVLGPRFVGAGQLTMTSRYDLAHPVCKEVFQPWLDTLRQHSHQRIDGRLYAPNVLCSDADVYQAVQVENVSIGVVSPGTQVPPLPVNLLFDLAIDFDSSEVGSQVLWELFTRYPVLQKELRMVHPLWGWVSSPSYLHTVDKPLRAPGEVSGRKLGVLSAVAGDIVKRLGGIPVDVSSKGLYHALKARMVDGALCPFPPMPSFGLLPFLRFSTDMPLHMVSFYLVMNREIWLALPDADKRVINQASGAKMARLCGRWLDEGEKDVKNQMQAAGHTFVALSDEERAVWRDSLKGLSRAHAERLQRRGLLGSEPLLEDIETLSRQIRLQQSGS